MDQKKKTFSKQKYGHDTSLSESPYCLYTKAQTP